MTWWLGALLGLLAGLAGGRALGLFGERQAGLHDRRRLLTVQQLELVNHAERLDVCRQARFGVPMPGTDWSWLRQHLVDHLDRGTLALLASYYAGLDTSWNPRFVREGTFDAEAERLGAEFAEHNRRLQQRLEHELSGIREVRVLGLTVLRDRPARRLSPGERAAS